MTQDMILDFSTDAMEPSPLSAAYRPATPRDPWLARRTHAWGGSEMAPLMLAYEIAPADAQPPSWMREQAEHYQRLGLPKIIAWKAGLRPVPAGDVASKERGNELERKLLDRWRATLAPRRVEPKSIRHSSSVPREFFPLVDRHCGRIAVTPDAWARAAHDRSLAIVSLKTTRKPIGGSLWHYEMQLQAEMATLAASGGVIVVGEGWQVDAADPWAKPRVRAFVVAPDPTVVAVQRALAIEAWALVKALRALGESKAAAKQARELWAASRDRMSVHRAPEHAAIETALDGIAAIDCEL